MSSVQMRKLVSTVSARAGGMNLDKAANYWERASKADPGNPQVIGNLGLLEEKRGNRGKALFYYREYMKMVSCECLFKDIGFLIWKDNP